MRSLLFVTCLLVFVTVGKGGMQAEKHEKTTEDPCPSLDVTNHENACYTPQGKPGVCVSIRCCPQLGDLFQPPVSPWNKTYLINSQCESPVKRSVCCGPPPEFPKKLNAAERTRQCKQPSVLPPDPWSGCCGISNIAGDRISGGKAAEIDDYPWLVLIEYSLVYGEGLFLGCGGSLISGKYVLTAGHCVAGSILDVGKPKIVRLGEYNITTDPDVVTVGHNLTDMTDKIVRIPIEEIVPHPKYDPKDPKRRNDIALIRLKEMVQYTFFIKPICLPKTDIKTVHIDTLHIAGWGAISKTQPFSTVKMYAEVPYVNLNECQKFYAEGSDRDIKLSETKHICAGGKDGKDACAGDSGGPLMYESSLPGIGLIMEAVGLVSFGSNVCSGDPVPGVYTNVYAYLGWIRSNIRP